SSRRRHTRSYGDWSSDVCSSDLPGYYMIALDAKIGRPVLGFGRNGIIDLKLEMDQEMDLINGEVGLHATPVVAGNTIIVGAAHRSEERRVGKERGAWGGRAR